MRVCTDTAILRIFTLQECQDFDNSLKLKFSNNTFVKAHCLSFSVLTAGFIDG